MIVPDIMMGNDVVPRPYFSTYTTILIRIKAGTFSGDVWDVSETQIGTYCANSIHSFQTKMDLMELLIGN